MKVELVPIQLRLPLSQGRSPGIHVSSLIRCIALETGVLDAKWAEDLSLVDVREITDPESILRISIGMAWDEWYSQQFDWIAGHPGEMQLDGIYMTHDGESIDVLRTERQDRHVIALHEFKATYKSVNTVWRPDLGWDQSLNSQWMWLTQCMAYCKALETTIAYLHVLFLCGDYTWPQRPRLGPIEGEFNCWRIEFPQSLIDTRWELLRDYRDHRLLTDGGTGL